MLEQIKTDMKQAMRDKDKAKLSTLRMLLATIEKKKIEKKFKAVEELSEADIIDAISKNVKTLDQEIDSLVKAGRNVSSQEAEKVVLSAYLPKQLTTKEILDEIALALKLVEYGQIKNPMQHLSKLKGKVDMKIVSKLLKEIE